MQDNASNADSTMPCGSARRCLWPASGPQAVTPELRAAQAHLLACAACQQFLRDMRHMAEQLRALAPSPPAPAAVRARVARTLAQARVLEALPSTPTRRRRWWGVAVVVCALGLGGWWAYDRPSEPTGQSSLRAVAEDHIRALHEDRILTSDPATVARWMGQRATVAIHVPTVPGATLAGGRICLLHGQRGMVLWYRVDGHLLSYYVMPGERHTGSDPAEGVFRHGAEAGYRVVAWWADGLFHALVGNLPDDRLRGLARGCMPRLADATPANDALLFTPAPERKAP